MKHVMDNAMIAHTWANPRCENDHARSHNGNMWFEGDTIYSYGRHFPIARHITNKHGDKAILFTTRNWGMATAKHITYTRRACHGTVFTVPLIDARGTMSYGDLGQGFHEFNLRHYQAQYDEAIEKAGRVTVNGSGPDWHLTYAANIEAEANRYADFFDLPEDINLRPATAETLDAINHRWARLNSPQAQAKRERANAKRREREAEKQLHSLTLWRFRQRSTLQARDFGRIGWNRLPMAMRVVGNEIQTTWGARFPVSDAKRAYPLIKRCKAMGRRWESNGKRIELGGFHINHITENGDVRAGCHFVPWSEIFRTACALGIA